MNSITSTNNSNTNTTSSSSSNSCCAKIKKEPIEPCIDLALPTTQVTRQTFPSASKSRLIFYEMNFNRLLDIIKNKMVNANNINTTFIKLLTNEIATFAANITTDVIKFLGEQEYTIVEIEDVNGIRVGWKISW